MCILMRGLLFDLMMVMRGGIVVFVVVNVYFVVYV